VQKCAAGTTGAADQILGQRLKVLAVVIIFFADQIHQTSPPPANANHLAALAQRANRNGADGWVQARYIAAAGQNSDYTFFCFHVTPYR